jgi:GT2 family glycosyltransferase
MKQKVVKHEGKELVELMRMKISIVLLSYNYFNETTKLCFESLAQDPHFNQWELIVVDNGSDDESPEQLRTLQKEYPSTRFIFCEKNLGFAGGVNTGIRQAKGQVVVLLNSDTICPTGMITRLADYCREDERIGMIGPVTNAAGNEQAIYTSCRDVEGIIAEGLLYANSGGPISLDAYRLDFCCVAIRGEAIAKVGLLDEGFGRGYFEDFDYSLRVKERGFRLSVAEDVFVYHRGSTAFGRLRDETRRLLKHNRRRIIDKHGASVLFPHTRECNLSILAQYLQKKTCGDAVSQYRIINRMQRAENDKPKNWLKRRRYLQRVNTMARQLGVEF